MNKIDVVAKVQEILRTRCDDPAEQIIMEGEALVAIGKALKGLSMSEARAVIQAVAAIQ